MGKSGSCFKIITCSNDAAENEESDVLEGRTSADKRGWSFSKRSGRHRVLNNVVSTVISAKDSSESSNISHNAVNIEGRERVQEEGTRMLSSIHSEVPNEGDLESYHEKIIVVQSSIRILLAQEKLLKLKRVVKMQALVRGHLVRRDAVGALYCIEAIVKIQTIARANFKHHDRRSSSRYLLEGSRTSNHLTAKNHSSSRRVVGPTSRLIRSGFARQLLESAPRTRIHFKCDFSKPGSALAWLERWSRVSSSSSTKSGIEESKPSLEKAGRKVISDSKKAVNTAFVAAQVKFEELVAANSYRNRIPKTRVIGSECGTEISVTSTLDSPDIIVSEVIEGEHEHGGHLPTGFRAGYSSPETVPETCGKAESETRKNEAGKNGSSHRRMSISNLDHDSGRNNSSSSSLPSYMQPTESARAKTYVSHSPKSSPDVQSKEVHSRKRHSLPGANGRQERTTGRILQNPNPHPPQERKWQR